MSGLCGWAGYAASDEARRRLLERMADALSRHDGHSIATVSTIGCAMATASLHGNTDLFHEGLGIAAITGRPVWTDPALEETSRRGGHARALARGYEEHGAGVLDRLGGPFALAVVRDGEWTSLLAVDRLGTLPLSYGFRNDCLVFGSTGAALQIHPRAESEIDPQAVYNYFFFHQVPAPGTIRKHHRRLLPGHRLTFEKGRIEVKAYASPEFAEQRRPLAQREEEFRELLRRSVGRAAEGAEVGCLLRGGADSAAVAGMLTEVAGAPVRTYSIGFRAKDHDEMEYARCTARHFGTQHHESYVTPEDVAEAVPRIAAIHSDPFASDSAVPTLLGARLAAQDGVQRMLVGGGGAELFGGNERYRQQRVFGRYEKVPRFVRKLFEAILFHFPAGGRIWPVGKARSYISQASTPLPERLYTFNPLLRLGARNVFEPDFLAGIDEDAPLALARHLYRSAHADHAFHRILALDYKFALADSELPNVNRSCDLAGVEAAYPLLSDELVDFAGALPVGLKLKGPKLRWFFKRALRDFLPQKVLRKPKHGFGLPFGGWLGSDDLLWQLAADSISDLKGRRIVRPGFADEILQLHRSEHASHCGVMVWTLVMLEQWFKVHEDQLAAVP